MEPGLKEQLTGAIIRFKRADNCLSFQTRLQISELAVMGRAYGSCTYPEKGMCVSEIQQTLHVSKPAVSQILNSLEKKGYIVRAIDPADRRKITVTVTASGEAELEDCQKCYSELLDRVLEQLGLENAKILIDQLNRLMDILEKL